MNKNIIEILIQARNQATAHLQAASNQLDKMAATAAVLTAGLVLALGAATASAVSYNEKITDTAAVLQLARDQQQQLSDELLRFGANTRAGPQAVATAFYDIAGGIADASTHMAVLEAATRTAEAGNAQLTGTTSAMISVMNSYGFSAEQAAFASNVLTQTVAKGVGTMDQFAAAIPLVAGQAANLGISFDALGAQMAFLTQKGFSASQSATILSGMMSALINPTEKMRDLMKAAGISSGEAALKNFGLAGTYDALAATAARTNISLATAVGQVEAYRGVLALTGDTAETSLNQFTVGLENATEAARNIQMQSAAAQLDLLRSTISALGIQAGEGLLPIINNLVQAIQPMLLTLFDWMQANPQLVTTIIAVIGAIVGIAPAMSAAATATNMLNTAMNLLGGPFGLIIKLGILMAAAIISNVGGIRDVLVKNFFPVIVALGDLFGALFAFLRPLMEALAKLFGGVLGGILNMLKPFLDVLMFVINVVTSLIKMLTGDLAGAMQSFGAAGAAVGINAPRMPGSMMGAQNAQSMAMQNWQSQQSSGMPFNLAGLGSGGNSSVMNMNINVDMPGGAMGSKFAAQEVGTDFGQAIGDQLNQLGVSLT